VDEREYIKLKNNKYDNNKSTINLKSVDFVLLIWLI